MLGWTTLHTVKCAIVCEQWQRYIAIAYTRWHCIGCECSHAYSTFSFTCTSLPWKVTPFQLIEEKSAREAVNVLLFSLLEWNHFIASNRFSYEHCASYFDPWSEMIVSSPVLEWQLVLIALRVDALQLAPLHCKWSTNLLYQTYQIN